MSDKDKAPERIRLVVRSGLFDGHWYFPDAAIMPFESEFHYVPESTLATVRREVWNETFKIQCIDCAEGDEPIYSKEARWFYHGISNQEVGCSASKLRIAALERTAESQEGGDDG